MQIIWFLSPLILLKGEKNIQTETTWFVSVCMFFEGSVFTNCWIKKVPIFDIIVNLHSQFVYFTLVLREQEEAKTKYSPPQIEQTTIIPGKCL